MDKCAATINAGYVPSLRKQIELNEVGINFVDIMKREIKSSEQLTFEEIYDNAIIMIVAVRTHLGLLLFTAYRDHQKDQ